MHNKYIKNNSCILINAFADGTVWSKPYWFNYFALKN